MTSNGDGTVSTTNADGSPGPTLCECDIGTIDDGSTILTVNADGTVTDANGDPVAPADVPANVDTTVAGSWQLNPDGSAECFGTSFQSRLIPNFPCPGLFTHRSTDLKSADVVDTPVGARFRSGFTFSGDWSGLGQVDGADEFAVGATYEYGCAAFTTQCAAEQVIISAQTHLATVVPVPGSTGDIGWFTQASVDGGAWFNVSLNNSISEFSENAEEVVSVGTVTRWVAGKGLHEICYRVLITRNDYVGGGQVLPNQGYGNVIYTELCS